MPNYLALIAKIIKTKQTVNPETVWRDLCATYCAEMRLTLNLYPSGRDCIMLAEWFVLQTGSPQNGQSLFLLALNQYFATRQFRPSGAFARMLEAYLSYYPDLILSLPANVRAGLSLKPYAVEIDKNDVKHAIEALYNSDSFSAAAAFCLLISCELDDEDLRLVATQLGVNLANDIFEVAQAASVTLQQLCRRHSNIDFSLLLNIVDRKLKEPDYFERKLAVLLLGEIAHLSHIDLLLILNKLEVAMQDESVVVRVTILKTLEKIVLLKNINLYPIATLLFNSLNDRSPAVRNEALEVWINLADNPYLVSILRKIAGGKRIETDPEIRRLAEWASERINEVRNPGLYQFLNLRNCSEQPRAAICIKESSNDKQAILKTELANLTSCNTYYSEKIIAVQRLAEIAAHHEQVAIAIVLPVFCQILHTAPQSVVDCIATSIVEVLPLALKNYFLLALLNPCLKSAVYDDTGQSNVRLNLLLAREIICHDSAQRWADPALSISHQHNNKSSPPPPA